MERDELQKRLKENEAETMQALWDRADQTRTAKVGTPVRLWGLIAISNYCVHDCLYCSHSYKSWGTKRYRMTLPEIIACAVQARDFGYESVVLRAGNDPGLDNSFIAKVIRTIKAATGLAITLNLGQRQPAELLAWRKAGADRYILRFETSDPRLFQEVHPTAQGNCSERLALLRKARNCGYEIGTGVMVGLPGQTWEILAQDLETILELKPDYIDLTSFRPNPRTPLGGLNAPECLSPSADEVPNDEVTTLKVVALARMLCPEADIRSTIAIAADRFDLARDKGLQCGANVLCPNLTPTRFWSRFKRQPWKECYQETAATCHRCLQGHVLSLGRTLDSAGPFSRLDDQNRASPCRLT